MSTVWTFDLGRGNIEAKKRPCERAVSEVAVEWHVQLFANIAACPAGFDL